MSVLILVCFYYKWYFLYDWHFNLQLLLHVEAYLIFAYWPYFMHLAYSSLSSDSTFFCGFLRVLQVKHTTCERAVLFLSALRRLCALFIYCVAWTSRARSVAVVSGQPRLAWARGSPRPFAVRDVSCALGLWQSLFMQLRKFPSVPSVLSVFFRNGCIVGSADMITWFFFF